MSGPAEATSDGEGPDATALAAAARACPSVVDVTGGPLDEIATYLPGSRIPGIRITEEAVEVHLIVAMTSDSLPAVGDEVRARLIPLAGGRRIDVHIDDLAPAEVTP